MDQAAIWERQLAEAEATEAIFADDFAATGSWRDLPQEEALASGEAISFSVVVDPALTLRFRLPPTYPDSVPPDVEVVWTGLGSVSAIRASLEAYLASLPLGDEIVYSIVTWCQENVGELAEQTPLPSTPTVEGSTDAVVSSAKSASVPGKLPLANYYRAEALGEGACGAVMHVYDDDGQAWAAKQFECAEDEGVDNTTLREIGILRALRATGVLHPHIVNLHDMAHINNELCMILCFYKCSLMDALQAGKSCFQLTGRMAFSLGAPLLLSSIAAVLAVNVRVEDRPVMKVVRLLQDMKGQLESELEDDKAVHEQLSCWCKENDQAKTEAIELGEARESQLKTDLGEAEAKMAELTAKRNAALEEVDRDFNALSEATALRQKENKESHAEEVNLVEAIKACDQAITVLKEYNPNAADFAQVRAAAHRLQLAQVLELGKRSLSAATSSQIAALRSFLLQDQGVSSFLAIPGYQSYAPQSGQIYGVLEQMKEDFEKDLSDNQAKEKSAADEFAALKAAKDEEIAAGRALVQKLDGEIADLKAKHAEAFKELEDVQAQLDLDRTFLANLKNKCAETDAEFEVRVKDRQTEIVAVHDTISILNADESFDNFESTVNTAFVQTAASTKNRESQEHQVRLRRVAKALESSAARLGVPALSNLAVRAKLDAFTRVKADIDKMIAELGNQQKDEVAHRDWCIDELNNNKRSTEAAYDKKSSLQAKIANLKKTIEHLTKEIDTAVKAVAETQRQMKRMSEVREAENADYQRTISDQRLTQQILNKALTRMKQVYAFLQRQPATVGAAHVATSGTHVDPGNGPARFTKYETNVGGGKVVAMLEGIIKDSRKMEDDAIEAEQDAQSVYEGVMQDSNKAITQYTKQIVHMKGALGTAKEDLTLATADLKATMRKLEELHETKGDLNGSCDYILKNFDARQEARTAEMNALEEAKAILSGAK